MSDGPCRQLGPEMEGPASLGRGSCVLGWLPPVLVWPSHLP